jgi:hypothetical protein
MKNYKHKLEYVFYILLVVGFFSCNNFTLKNQNKSVNIGDVYLYSHEWDTEDPFEKIDIDTVLVVGIKGDYVAWYPDYRDSSFYLSGKLKYFKHNIRPLN